jgi:hypothetical protein
VWSLVVLVALTSSALVVSDATPVLACSCVAGDPSTALDNDIVFLGRPVKVVPFGGAPRQVGQDGPGGYITTFAVERVFKGNVGNKQRIVTSAEVGAGCGLAFSDERTVVIANRGAKFAGLTPNAFADFAASVRRQIRRLPATNSCTSLNAPDVDNAVTLLGEGRPPR